MDADVSFYYDCKVNFFKSMEDAIKYFKNKHGSIPEKVIVTSTGWLVGPVPEDELERRMHRDFCG